MSFARLYNYSAAKRAALAGDKVTYWKNLYDKHGEGRTNLAYGYVTRGYAPAGT